MINDRWNTADIRISWDCRWEPTVCFFFMCTFGVRWRESEREKEKTVSLLKNLPTLPPPSKINPIPTSSVPHFPHLPFAIVTDISRKYFYILSVTFGSKVLPIFRNYNSLLPRTRKRGDTVEISNTERV